MFVIDPGLGSALTGTKMGILRLTNVSGSASLADEEVAAGFAEIQRRYGNLSRDELKAVHPIRVYVDYYRKYGKSYHVLGQLESVLKGRKALHAGSGLLQAMFLCELESMLLVAGHDAAKLRLPLQLRVAAGNEAYQAISGKTVTADANDLMVCDSGGVISSILRGPDFNSRITPATTDVIFTVYAPPGIEAADVATHLQALERRIGTFSPDARTEDARVFIAAG